MVRDDSMSLLRQHVTSETLIEHCVATGAIMWAVAPHLNGDPDLFETIGILHDIDYEIVSGDMERHGMVGAEMLHEAGISEEIADAVRKHNNHLFSDHSTPVDLCLQSSDSISGLIIACALVKGGAIEEVTVKTVKKKMKDKGFAAGCDRERIRAVDSLMDLDLFIQLAIEGVTRIWMRSND